MFLSLFLKKEKIFKSMCTFLSRFLKKEKIVKKYVQVFVAFFEKRENIKKVCIYMQSDSNNSKNKIILSNINIKKHF